MKSSRVFRFDVFELDRQSGELRRQGAKVKLQKQPADLLAALLERPGEVFTREELREWLWPGQTIGDFEIGLNKAVRRLREALNDSAQNPRYIETLPHHGYRFIGVVSETSPSLVPIKAVAVLPFADLSGDPGQEYFADGITDSLITELGKIGALRVISRQSVLRYKKVDKPLPEISRELNVDAVLEGTVVRVGNRVRITAQLLRATPEQHLWAESYERSHADILALQRDIARNVADHVHAKLTPGEGIRLAPARTVNPESHEHYLRGQYFFYGYTPDRLQKAIESFQAAVEKDPGFALAWAALSPAYGALAYWGHVRPSEVVPKAKVAAQKAVELDETLADGHCYLGAAAAYADWDWATAEIELKRAIDLNPSHVEAHANCGMVLGSLRRPREAMDQFQMARELDPLQSVHIGQIAWCLYTAGQYQRGLDQIRPVVGTLPDLFINRWFHWRLLHRMGEDAEALAECKRMYELLGDTDVVRAQEQGERQSGYQGAMRAMAVTLAKRARNAYVAASQIALLYAHAGEDDSALDWLENALKDGDPRLHMVWADPDWESLYRKPRFENLLRRMGFPSVEKATAWSVPAR